MKTYYKMKEATNKEEAIISILDVLNQSPLWLNKCTSKWSVLLQRMHSMYQQDFLNRLNKEEIIDLFVEFKTEYYNFKDNTQWNY